MNRLRKTLLFVLQRPPYGRSSSRETLDTALACAAFEQNVQLLFSGDGVWQLLPEQQGTISGEKDIGKMLAALHYYDINAVFVDSFSLAARQLTVEQLAIPAIVLDACALRALLRNADNVLAL